jgi:hypothetical protein
MLGDSACWLVISEVARMNTNGSRNAIDRAMATEWLATDSSSRRRRILAGTGRRARGAAAAPRAVVALTGSLPGSGPTDASCG